MKKWILYITFLISIIIFIINILDVNSYIEHRNQESLNQGKQITNSIANHIDSLLNQIMDEGQSLADKISESNMTKNELMQLIKSRSEKYNSILGITAAFEPFKFNKTTKLFAPYYDKNHERFIFIENVYNYTDNTLTTSQWYVKVIENGNQWIEPYYAQGAKALVADYGTPIKKGNTKIGTITMTISLKQFRDLLNSISLGKTGYGMVISKEGNILSHPTDEYVGRKSLSDLINLQSDKSISKSFNKMKENKNGFIQFTDKVTNDDAFLFFKTIPSTRWKIGIIFIKNDLLGPPIEIKQKYIKLIAIGSFSFLLLWIILFRLYNFTKKRSWNLSISISTLILINIISIWYFESLSNERNNSKQSPPITNNTILDRFVKLQLNKADNQNTNNPFVIPTGLYIDKLEFDDAYNVNISGRIWQKYDSSAVNKIVIGFDFPQTSPFAEASYISESYRKSQKNNVLIGWNFRLTLRMNFDYSHYPFEKRNVNIRITPKELNKNVLFIPDLNSYKTTIPTQKPGLSNSIKLPGSVIIESFFSFDENNINTNFGYDKNELDIDLPILYFNIMIKRNLINAFVSNLIPIFVVLLMMFILLFNSTKHVDSQKPSTQSIGVVESLAAFFFVLIFSHIDLRRTVEASQLMYMEYFYIVLYFMLIVYVYNLLTYTRNQNIKIFDYQDNLIAKITYGPIFLFVIYVITVFTFY